MIFDHIDWDEHNLDHATQRLTADEIEQAIWNATGWRKHNSDEQRRLINSITDGGKHVLVVIQVVRNGVRPITAWEE